MDNFEFNSLYSSTYARKFYPEGTAREFSLSCPERSIQVIRPGGPCMDLRDLLVMDSFHEDGCTGALDSNSSSDGTRGRKLMKLSSKKVPFEHHELVGSRANAWAFVKAEGDQQWVKVPSFEVGYSDPTGMWDLDYYRDVFSRDWKLEDYLNPLKLGLEKGGGYGFVVLCAGPSPHFKIIHEVEITQQCSCDFVIEHLAVHYMNVLLSQNFSYVEVLRVVTEMGWFSDYCEIDDTLLGRDMDYGVTPSVSPYDTVDAIREVIMESGGSMPLPYWALAVPHFRPEPLPGLLGGDRQVTYSHVWKVLVADWKKLKGLDSSDLVYLDPATIKLMLMHLGGNPSKEVRELVNDGIKDAFKRAASHSPMYWLLQFAIDDLGILVLKSVESVDNSAKLPLVESYPDTPVSSSDNEIDPNIDLDSCSSDAEEIVSEISSEPSGSSLLEPSVPQAAKQSTAPAPSGCLPLSAVVVHIFHSLYQSLCLVTEPFFLGCLLITLIKLIREGRIAARVPATITFGYFLSYYIFKLLKGSVGFINFDAEVLDVPTFDEVRNDGDEAPWEFLHFSIPSLRRRVSVTVFLVCFLSCVCLALDHQHTASYDICARFVGRWFTSGDHMCHKFSHTVTGYIPDNLFTYYAAYYGMPGFRWRWVLRPESRAVQQGLVLGILLGVVYGRRRRVTLTRIFFRNIRQISVFDHLMTSSYKSSDPGRTMRVCDLEIEQEGLWFFGWFKAVDSKTWEVDLNTFVSVFHRMSSGLSTFGEKEVLQIQNRTTQIYDTRRDILDVATVRRLDNTAVALCVSLAARSEHYNNLMLDGWKQLGSGSPASSRS
jgi:hypothetical protein